MKRQTAILFYVLGAYVVLQFGWWGYHLIELTSEVEEGARRIIMIIGEGSVFFLILLLGLWQIRRSIRKELELSERQNNFLLSVTHELKTPLATNKLYLQTLEKRQLDEEKRRELLAKAIEENRRLEMMIDNILYASRIENRKFQLHREELNLDHLMEQVAARFGRYVEPHTIKLECRGGCFIHADPFMMEIVVTNLLENAIKYGEKDGITLFTHCDEQHVAFGVRNAGTPIPKEHQKAIFQKFFRLQNEETRSSKGTGLGLYIVAQFVRLHGARIELRSSENTGTEFRVIFSKVN